MLVGYARVSTSDLKLGLQLDALLDTDCERIFEEKLSAAGISAPGHHKMLHSSTVGDVVVSEKTSTPAEGTLRSRPTL